MTHQIQVTAETEAGVRDKGLEDSLKRQLNAATGDFSGFFRIKINIFRHKNKFHVKSRIFLGGQAYGQDLESMSLLALIRKNERHLQQKLKSLSH